MTKYLWFFSILLFLGASTLIYIELPDFVVVVKNLVPLGDIFMLKANFFYFSQGILLLVNLALGVITALVPTLPKRLVFVPGKQQWFYNKETRKELLLFSKGWGKGLALIINLFLLASLANIAVFNKVMEASFTWAFYLVAGLLTLWLVFFFVLFSSKPTALAEVEA